MEQANLLCHRMKIPETLDHLMYCLTKEILCKQPDNVYEFSTKFFHQLVEERDGPNRTPFVESLRSKSCKPSSLSIVDAGTGLRDLPNEDGEKIDDFEKELEQLNDETLRAEDMSPPPTLDDSMSDNDTSVTKIAAIVTSKARESPPNATSTSISRANSNDAIEIRNSPENAEEAIEAVEAINAFADETFKEDALDVDALPDSVTEVLDEGQPEVAQSTPEEHVEEPEITTTPTEETNDDPHLLADSNGIEETEHLEPQEMVIEEEATENELQENIEDDKPQEIDENELETNGTENDVLNEELEENEPTPVDMVDAIDSSLLQAEEEMTVNEELPNSSPLDDTEEQEVIADGVENSEIVANNIEESENAETEPTNLVENTDAPEATDLPTDADMEETIQLEPSEMVAEDETNENELQENTDEDKPQEIDANESEIDEIEKDQSNENAEENEQIPADVLVDPPMAQEEGETADVEEVLNSVTLEDCSEERETEAENVENQEVLTDQLDESDNAADTPADLLEHSIDEEQHESSHVPEMNIRVPRSTEFIDMEQDSPVEMNEDDHLDIEEVGSSSVVNIEDELSVAQEHDEEVKQIENSDLEEHIQDENEAIEVSENMEGNDNHTEETETEKLDESEVFAISDLVDEQPSQLENIEEILPEVESEDVTNETPDDNNLHQDASFTEEQPLLSPVIEDSPFEVENTEENVCQASEDNVLADENADQNHTLEQDDALIFAENVMDSESAIIEEPEAELNETTSHVSCDDTQENGNLQSELDNEKPIPDLKENGISDEDFNELVGEGDKEVSNDDEEEIWNKLQKDLELEEEEQRNLAAIKIQSTFRGYKTRKEFNEMSENQNETEDEIDIVNDIVENVPEDQPSVLSQEEEPLENNDDDKELTGALAGVTESEDHNDDELDGNLGSENVIDALDEFLSNQREVNDVTEEPMSNGEEIHDVQLIESYVITSSVTDNSASPEATTNLENSQDNESVSVKDIDDGANETSNPEAEAVASDPGVVFELYVESNETTNDGLLESYCPQREDPSREKHVKYTENSPTENTGIGSDAAESLGEITPCNTNGSIQQNQLDPCLLERENLAAIKIQAGYRGHQDRKRVQNLKHQIAENVSSTGTDIDTQEELRNAAATKIQAGFRGHQDRKRIHKAKCHTTETSGTLQTHFNVVDEERQFNHSGQQVQPDPCSMELQNAAATKIQAGFRGHQDRKRIKNLKAPTIDHNVNDKVKSCDESLVCDDEECFEELGTSPSTMDLQNAAATKIQAGFRGHQDRKRVKHLQHRIAEKDVKESDTLQCMDTNDAPEQSNGEQSNGNLCLTERENAAATTIQAGFRGHQARKQVKDLQRPSTSNDGIENGESKCTDTFHEANQPNVKQSQQNLCLKELENAAATKIQAGFRGYRDRKNVKHLKKPAKTKDLISHRETNFVEEDCLLDGDEFIQNSERNALEKENMAAAKIQAGFRGHQDRKRVKCLKQNIAATKIQAGFRGHQDRKRVKNLKESINKSEIIPGDSFNYDEEEASLLDYDQSAEEIEFEQKNNAATKIQAGFRGHQDRKRVKNLKESINKSEIIPGDSFNYDEEEASLLDYDQSAEEIEFELKNSAATKIQAGFRGHQDRKRVKNLQHHIAEHDKSECMDDNLDPDQLNTERSHQNEYSNELENAAATKIQAGFRGYQDRKIVKNLKQEATSNETSFTKENGLFDRDDIIQHGERNSLDEENIAATKIQAGFRGHQDRKRVKRLKDSTNRNETIDSDNASYIEETSVLDQSAEATQLYLENDAATKIQAGFRGHRDRKRVKNLQYRAIENEVVDSGRAEDTSDPDQSNIEQSHKNLCDANELENAAATKIQAGFRGYQDRKNVNNLKKEAATKDLINTKEPNFIEDDVDVQDSERILLDQQNSAATKIQAGFRGQQDRKRVKYLKDSVTRSEIIDSECCDEEALLLDYDPSAEALQIEHQNAAATKIQAGFRGHQDRKRVKNLKISADVSETF